MISYHKFKTEKGTPKERDITAPNNGLKKVQKRILVLLRRVVRPYWLVSGEKGKSYIDNGKMHLSCKYALMIDIRKFYDNCGREPVYRFFSVKLKTSPDVAKVLTDITTFEDKIPTGCPTSQLIAYYAYSDMFNEIAAVARVFGCTFTLYVDDMTFSSTNPFPVRKLRSEVDKVLRKYGHRPKYRKVKYYGKDDAKPITGTVITPTNRLDVPNKLQNKVYCGFKEIQAFDADSLLDTESQKMLEKKLSTLRGQLQASKNINASRFREIGRIFECQSKEKSQTPA